MKTMDNNCLTLWDTVGPGAAGAVFSAGWWFWVDAVVCSDVKISFIHYLPGFCSLPMDSNSKEFLLLWRLSYSTASGKRTSRTIIILPTGSRNGGSSSMPDVGPYTYPYSTPAPYSSQEGMFSPFQSWQAAGSSMYPHPSVYMPQMHPVYPIVPFQPGPSQEISDVTPLDDTEQTTDQAEDDVRHQQHHLRDRPRRPPAHYTPGSDALPPRRHRRH